MKYHDYHLEGYSVTDFGKTITLNLVYNYPGASRDESKISFSDAIVHHFICVGGAIIVDINESKPSEMSKEQGAALVEWASRFGGLAYYDGDLERFKLSLEQEGFKLWTIWSAVGFEGLVIAKNVV